MTASHSFIHPSAIVESGAILGERVKIGPFCHVGSEATLEDDVKLLSHVAVAGRTHLEQGVKIYPFASVGHAPQDLKYNNEKSILHIGARTVIRENATLNPGTQGGGMITKVGKDCLLMIGTHVAHDCIIGNNVIMANAATLAGHVQIGDHAIIGGLSAVKQFVRIGHHAIIGGMSGVENDVIPYGSVIGERAWLGGLNVIGMKRRGFSRTEIHALRAAYRLIFAKQDKITFLDRLDQAEVQFKDSHTVQDLIAFIRHDPSKPICQPKDYELSDEE